MEREARLEQDWGSEPSGGGGPPEAAGEEHIAGAIWRKRVLQ